MTTRKIKGSATRYRVWGYHKNIPGCTTAECADVLDLHPTSVASHARKLGIKFRVPRKPTSNLADREAIDTRLKRWA